MAKKPKQPRLSPRTMYFETGPGMDTLYFKRERPANSPGLAVQSFNSDTIELTCSPGYYMVFVPTGGNCGQLRILKRT